MLNCDTSDNQEFQSVSFKKRHEFGKLLLECFHAQSFSSA